MSNRNSEKEVREMRNAETILGIIRNDTGEPDDAKVSRPVRRGADGKVLR